MLAAPDQTIAPTKASTHYVALTGNPNCGKTTLFNALTGLRAKVGNYAGVTVERKEGRLLGTVPPQSIQILDLPGTYSLSPQSLDEQISRDVLLNRIKEIPSPALVVVVIDASNLQRNLYYATQVIELNYPTLIVLNMTDVAQANGMQVDADALSVELSVPVISMVARTGNGLPQLREAILSRVKIRAGGSPHKLFPKLPPALAQEVDDLASELNAIQYAPAISAQSIALLALTDERFDLNQFPSNLRSHVQEGRERLEKADCDWRSAAIEARYGAISHIQEKVTTSSFELEETFSDKLDKVLTHKVWGMALFLLIMALMFQSIFTLAEYPMTWIESGVAALGDAVGKLIPPGDLHSLIVDGIIAGVGAVIVFLPQICLLFIFIGLLEDTGYMARAAFLMDRLMSKVGLHGKSFIPMLSSFACAIPGIMATRTIESPKDRLVTILVAPLMSCSARLPVYTLLIAATIPDKKIFGFFRMPGLTLLAMYLLGIVMALLMAWLFKKTLLKGETPLLIMELPPYKKPVFAAVIRHMWERSKLFLKRAGTVILGISILLWFFATYPRDPQIAHVFAAKRAVVEQAMPITPSSPESLIAAKKATLEDLDHQESGEMLRNSYAGRTGRLIAPFIAPLGFDWKIGIGIISSFAAREVFVSTMSTVYNVAGAESEDEGTNDLATILKEQTWENGAPVYTPLVGVTLMVFYVLALQCVSTIAIVRRETNSWRWPIFQWVYMGALAWILAFVTYQGGRMLGY
ncbi:MAG: ferrous iron transport protein B [Verrucomicrobiales bacterium]